MEWDSKVKSEKRWDPNLIKLNAEIWKYILFALKKLTEDNVFMGSFQGNTIT